MLNNHLRFTILYHRDLETDLARIVGFEVEPFSVKHSYEGTWDTTGLSSAVLRTPCPANQAPTMLARARRISSRSHVRPTLATAGNVADLLIGHAGKKKPELKTCNPGSMKFVTDKEPKQPVETDQEVIFTYDVLFQVRRQECGAIVIWDPVC